ncbi:MAG TPA: aminotransferase class III-fold pyridoxal phosphate-dependent enzyme [Pelovirga sp.]|nr:aminotransferase class III-fold pyridoxal phosphate-dependent enzyme [Pelovirga sp.]
MSLEKIGNRTPSEYSPNRDGQEAADNAEGIPGLDKSFLFYQDKSRLPKVSHGQGIYIYDTEGKEYLDGCSGAISANLGHNNARMKEAAVAQLDKIAFTYRKQFENEPANQLAELLVQLSPPELDRVFFVNSGSEAVETTLKIARQYWWSVNQKGKSLVLSCRPSYHGATMGALARTDYAPLNIPFVAMTGTSPKIPAPFCYHCLLDKSYPECGIACAFELETTIRMYGADNIAAFIVEPIGGASTGAAVPPDEYFPLIERICHENNILLIIDDVMTGCGRSGTFYGYGHWDITPDIVAVSKGVSAGYTPIGAVITADYLVGPILEAGGFMHGHTYAGNPLSAAIAHEAVRIILDDSLVERSGEYGVYLHERLHALKARYPIIGDVRGRGLFAGIEFVRDRELRKPFPANWYVALEATEIARAKGLLIYPRRSLCGLSGDHVLIAPPLIIEHAEIDILVERFEQTLEQLTRLLLHYMMQEKEAFKDSTVERFRVAKDLPDYAIGAIDEIGPAEDANITSAMESGHTQTEEDFYDSLHPEFKKEEE